MAGTQGTRRKSNSEIETRIATLEGYVVSRFQTKALAANVSTGTSDIATLRYNNLTIGKTYRLTANTTVISSNNTGRVFIQHNGGTILNIDGTVPDTATNDRASFSASIIFVATATTIVTNYQNVGGTAILEGNGTTGQTFLQLEELINCVPTTQWS